MFTDHTKVNHTAPVRTQPQTLALATLTDAGIDSETAAAMRDHELVLVVAYVREVHQ